MKFLLISLIALPGIIAPSEAPVHKFYLSKCLIEYKPEKKSVQVTLHLFLDDLELALERKGAKDLFLCTTKEAARADSLVARYLAQNLQLITEKEKLHLSFLGKEMADDFAGAWCYLEALNVDPPRQLQVKNKLLTEVFEEQQNIVNIRYEGKKEDYFLFTKDKNSGTSYFED
jgi:hypothetical protein